MKKINYISLLILIFCMSLQAQEEIPSILYPANGQRYVQAKNLPLQWDNSLECQIQVSTNIPFQNNNILIDTIVNNRTHFVDRLEQNTEYFWRLRINFDSEDWSEIYSFTTTGNPVVPKLESPKNGLKNLDKIISFDWSSDTVNTSYIIEISPSSNFNQSNISIKTDTDEFTIPNLDFAKTYYWHVKSLNIDGIESNWSAARSLKTRLKQPELLFPTADFMSKDTVITFLWLEIESADSYQLLLAKDSNFIELITDTTFFDQKLAVSSLEFNSDYFWKLFASNDDGDRSLWSETRRFRTGLRQPKLYSPSNNGLITPEKVEFNWSDVNNANRFQIQISSDSMFTQKTVDQVSDTTVFYSDTLESNLDYFWRVIAMNDDLDLSNWSDTNSFKTKLYKPENISPVNRKTLVPNNAQLRWGEILFATEYRIQVANDSLFQKMVIEASSDKNNVVVFDLTKDEIFFWRVKAISENNESEWSDGTYFRTAPDIVLFPKEINKTLNLSETPTDTLETILISNYGNDFYLADSVFISPGSVFYSSITKLTLKPDESKDIAVLFNPDSVVGQLYKCKLNFVRKFANGIIDTTSINISAQIRMASLALESDTVKFDTTNAQQFSLEKLRLSNTKSNIDLQIDSLVFTADSSAFKISNSLKTISSNNYTELQISFSPINLESNKDTLIIYTNSYPKNVYHVYLEGYGKGGLLSESTLQNLNEINKTKFETITNNFRSLNLENSGNSDLEYTINFTNKNFELLDPINNSRSLRKGKSVNLFLKYTASNFDTLNIDTLNIFHNGLGVNPLKLEIKGGFDSLASSGMINTNLYVNNAGYSKEGFIVPEKTAIYFKLVPELLNQFTNMDYKVLYYNGAMQKPKTASYQGNFNYKIPKEFVNDNGIIFYSELFTKDKYGNKIDSIQLTQETDIQVILENFRTEPVNVERSIPAETANIADTKWAFFGFPFKDVVADSVLQKLGGVKKLEDGEAIVYKYNLTDTDSFTIFDDYYFEDHKGYFLAQALTDSFDISYTYNGAVRTRKLSDNTIKTIGSGWKVISSPFTFDIEADESATLYEYQTFRKSYKTTNIMKPGLGYFVEPDIDSFKVKTYGVYNPLNYPKILADIGWHLNLEIEDEIYSQDLRLSLSNGILAKNNSSQKLEYEYPPSLNNNEISIQLLENGKHVSALVGENMNGKYWDIKLASRLTREISISQNIIGNMPEIYQYKIYDFNSGKEFYKNENITLVKNNPLILTIVLGTEEFITNFEPVNSENIPAEFSLSQNYPNPFNPSTIISFQLPIDSKVLIEIYNTLGEKVKTLMDKEQSAGKYKISFNASDLSGGVYFYQLKAKSFSKTRKMILLK
ncbi:MAG: T9SS type A sorting domain-containing protein [Melioribacteraceae bacterium]|nr:T9SS type A sorting domain-containing protein [Melioribacteraceae bacterium]